MCGIAGFIDLRQKSSSDELMSVVKSMSDRIIHRGPDSSGHWLDEGAGVALGHRRLSILDLSEAGHQPMESKSKRYVIVFNGEIYNFLSIKSDLIEKGYEFSSHSDTEVLLMAMEEWGLEKTLSKINGMFAFALWDKKERLLHLARDRMGKKPLYYGWSGNSFIFGSELKALRVHPDFKPEVDRNALTAYVRHNYVPSPWSIYKGIYKLPAASFKTISLDMAPGMESKKYWDLEKLAKSGISNPLEIGFDEAVKEFEAVLEKAVSERMVSDVPLGSFLSGGIDSSLVTALMQKNSSTPIKTFCIGFEETGYNEAPYAKEVSKHLGTDHTEYFVTAEETRNVIPDLPSMFDEPFADPSQIPTYHVSKLARQEVTVALSGDGGDEGFSGYDRYHRAMKASDVLNKIPSLMREPLSMLLQAMPLDGKLKKISELLKNNNENEFYRLMMSYWDSPEKLVLSGSEPQIAMNDHSDLVGMDGFMNRMMYMDMTGYLPDDILVKVDRASMAASLEVRAPLLDYNVIEYAWRTPLSMKISGGSGKKLLKSVLGNHVPTHLFDRPKQGFGIPHGKWLRGPLKDWAETLLSENRLQKEGFFNPAMVRKKWNEHISGKKDWSYALWGILMFQAWYEQNG